MEKPNVLIFECNLHLYCKSMRYYFQMRFMFNSRDQERFFDVFARHAYYRTKTACCCYYNNFFFEPMVLQIVHILSNKLYCSTTIFATFILLQKLSRVVSLFIYVTQWALESGNSTTLLKLNCESLDLFFFVENGLKRARC